MINDLTNGQAKGKWIYQPREYEKPGWQLVAKTRHSFNHQIAETFNFYRGKWEKSTFFGQSSFLDKISEKDDGNYKDHLLFFEKIQQ